MLDWLIWAALKERAQTRPFPPRQAAQPVMIWIKQRDGGRGINGEDS